MMEQGLAADDSTVWPCHVTLTGLGEATGWGQNKDSQGGAMGVVTSMWVLPSYSEPVLGGKGRGLWKWRMDRLRSSRTCDRGTDDRWEMKAAVNPNFTIRMLR
jgi:hypothetical protein